MEDLVSKHSAIMDKQDPEKRIGLMVDEWGVWHDVEPGTNLDLHTTMEEVHRFANEPVEYAGALHWDAPRLWFELRKTLSRLEETELGGIGVDAWGVDYALLGERGELLQNPYHYRDKRTDGVMELVFAKVSKDQIYRETGIQFIQINTLYQLFAAKRDTPNLLRAARKLLLEHQRSPLKASASTAELEC